MKTLAQIFRRLVRPAHDDALGVKALQLVRIVMPTGTVTINGLPETWHPLEYDEAHIRKEALRLVEGIEKGDQDSLLTYVYYEALSRLLWVLDYDKPFTQNDGLQEVHQYLDKDTLVS